MLRVPVQVLRDECVNAQQIDNLHELLLNVRKTDRECWMQVIDSVEDYLKLMRTIFDFDALKALLHKPDFTFTFDAMHGVAGPYARRIFVQVQPCMIKAHTPDSATDPMDADNLMLLRK